MLFSLLAPAVVLAQVPVSNTQAFTPAAKARLRFNVDIPPVPIAPVNGLRLTGGRKLIPLNATLTLDGKSEETRDEQDLINAINSERASRGLGSLAADPVLSEAAAAHSREMSERNYFDHFTPPPDPKSPTDRYLDELAQFGEKRPAGALVGENLFYASVTNDVYNASYAHHSLMASPSHRENILEPRFTKVGVGVYRDPQGKFWVTEMFLRDS